MLIFFHGLRALLHERVDLALEIMALRQQLAVFKEKRSRPPVSGFDRAFWVALRRLWSKWSQSLIIVQPETVIRWHREGFRRYCVLTDNHARRLLQEYVRYYNADRCHLGLAKDTPSSRRVEAKPFDNSCVAALPRLGGLHHRYEWREAA